MKPMMYRGADGDLRYANAYEVTEDELPVIRAWIKEGWYETAEMFFRGQMVVPLSFEPDEGPHGTTYIMQAAPSALTYPTS